MPEAILKPQKRILGDSTKTHENLQPVSPNATKKRKLEADQPSIITRPRLQDGFRKAATPASSQSQHKSKFVEEVLEKLTQDISGLKESNAEKDQQWERPSLDDFDPTRDSLCFQQIEAEEGPFSGDQTAVRLFGVTEAGHSVLLHVTDFKHYLYVAAPVSFTKSDCEPFGAYLENHVGNHQTVIHNVQMVMKENLFGFQGNQQHPYLRITVTDPKYINRVRSTIESGNANYRGLWKVGGTDGILTFDNIQYILRFMIDTGISGMSWVEVPPSKYRIVPEHQRYSNCQIEAVVHYRDLIAHPHDGEWAKMAPLRILSFDIECAGRKGIFPEAHEDPVIQIANVVTRYGESKPFVRNVFVLNGCSLIVNTQILDFKTEQEMLMAWRDFLEKVDPDVIIGYNIANFDFPYLLDRARHLNCDDFPYWSRLKNVVSQSKDTNFSSKQMGNRDTKATNTNGRIQLDLLQLIQRDHQLRNYTLNSVCSHFLGEQKEDVHHTMITELYNGTPDSRRRLAVYCLKDAYLPQRLMDKLMCLVNYTEMARVTGVPFNFLLSRGQQVKFISQLFRKALEQDLVIPNLKNENGEEQYKGATVIEPVKDYYDVPIATLDFASLYPSIIQAHNLCYTTLLNKTSVEKLKLKKDEDYIVTPNGDMFCTSKVRKGLLSQILQELLSARKRAKKELAVETDPFKKAVLNGRQLALKISANSVYGITGASNGKLPCLAIASSTTSYGRQMIMKTKDEVEARFTMANGYPYDAKVIYGDTDSVMVKFGVKDIAEAMKLGQEAANFVSAKFLEPIKLEFEKVYFPYLLINKKRYAGLFWTNPNKFDKMDSKGIETVRRDNCRLVQTVIETVLKKILIDRDVKGAENYVKDTIADLLQNKVDMSKLVITKALSKSDYSAKQAHVELAERMRKRDVGSAPTLGDRVAYVIVKGATGSKNYEKSEDPIYVLENNIPIDTKYYLDNQLAKPLARIFDPILGERRSAQLLTGEHTRSISVAAPTLGGLMKFAKKTQTCMGCKKPLVDKDEKEGAVCENCRPRLGELYSKTLNKVSDLEVRFGRLWTQCQRCQGSLHCEVICSSRDCPIFYMRMKAKKDVEDAERELARFDHDPGAW
uniref:DNA polymerase n=1 Tax=Coccidioides posadasii RMSCC 3488 TaxID=454284 RepID=A0A0J6FP09_COCPO|nr:DNA polymerase delta catalytic subunit [Coccidioides posadasii RMSCC 3488]